MSQAVDRVGPKMFMRLCQRYGDACLRGTCPDCPQATTLRMVGSVAERATAAQRTALLYGLRHSWPDRLLKCCQKHG